MQKTVKPTLPNPFILPPETNGRFMLMQLLAYVSTFAIASNLGRFLTGQIPALSDERSQPLRDTLGLLLGVAMVCALWIWSRHRVAQAARETIAALDLHPGAAVAKTSAEIQAIADAEHHIRAIAARVPELTAQPDLVWRRSRSAELQLNGLAFGGAAQSFVCLFYSLSTALQIAKSRPSFYTIVLHELAHLANQDVPKTVAARETFRAFRIMAAVMAGLLFGIALLNGLLQISSYGIDEVVVAGIQLLLTSVIQLLCVFLLVQVAFRSILRVREYYADARAVRWLGLQHPYRLPSDAAQRTAADADSALDWLRALPAQLLDRIAPTHPTAAQRGAAVQEPTILFGVSIELAALSGALVGVSLNTGFQLVTLVSSMIDLARQALPDSALPALLSLLYPLVLVGVVLCLCLLPLAGSLGLQTQRATLADVTRARPQQSSLRALLPPALAAGCGLVAGAAATPAPNALSLWGSALLLAPVYAAGWAALVLIWMACLRWITRRLARAGCSAEIFRRRARMVRWASALGAAPIFTMAALTHVVSSVLITFPDMLGTFGVGAEGVLTALMIALWVVAGIGCVIICAAGVARAGRAGWFTSGVCAACGAPARSASAGYCGQCGASRCALNERVPMLELPPPPQRPPSAQDTEPPPLTPPSNRPPTEQAA